MSVTTNLKRGPFSRKLLSLKFMCGTPDVKLCITLEIRINFMKPSGVLCVISYVVLYRFQVIAIQYNTWFSDNAIWENMKENEAKYFSLKLFIKNFTTPWFQHIQKLFLNYNALNLLRNLLKKTFNKISQVICTQYDFKVGPTRIKRFNSTSNFTWV